MEVHIRHLVALPLLIAAELVVHRRMRSLVKLFLERRLIPEGAMARFETAIAAALRLRNSVLAEMALIALVYGVGILIVWHHHTTLDTSTWYATPSSDGSKLSPPGCGTERLLAVLREPAARDGQWQVLDCTPPWEGNWTWDCFLIFAWQGLADARLLVTVNYAPNQSQCYVPLPFADLGNTQWRLEDVIGDAAYAREGKDLQARGLYLDLSPWRAHVFSLTKLNEVRPQEQ